MKEEYDLEQNDSSTQSALNDHYWKEKERTVISTRVLAHQCVIAHKSPFFATFFKEEAGKPSKAFEDGKLVLDFHG